jgi:hypothetical protein
MASEVPLRAKGKGEGKKNARLVAKWRVEPFEVDGESVKERGLWFRKKLLAGGSFKMR